MIYKVVNNSMKLLRKRITAGPQPGTAESELLGVGPGFFFFKAPQATPNAARAENPCIRGSEYQ